MAEEKILKVRVSLKGRPIRTYSFNQDSIQVGRSPDCDIFLDNPGVSRHHLSMIRGPGGHYRAEDAGSANGTFLNDERLSKEYLMNDDVVRIGKYSLWVRYEADRRGPGDSKAFPPDVVEGTTVLSTDELERMLQAKDEEPGANLRVVAGTRAHDASADPARTRTYWVLAVVIAFVLGTALGAGTTKLLAG